MHGCVNHVQWLARPRLKGGTMRELLVLRHAKSSWEEIDKRDHDRSLAPRGIEAARRMGELIQERGWLPDRIICSTATRAQETLALARSGWPIEPPIATSNLATLYMATPSRLMEIVRRQPDDSQRLLVVGHNPGLQSFVMRLIGKGAKADVAAIADKLPTAALAVFAFDVASWQALNWMSGELVAYEYPKKLAAASD
jgi:phosphohistidine phosphatase